MTDRVRSIAAPVRESALHGRAPLRMLLPHANTEGLEAIVTEQPFRAMFNLRADPADAAARAALSDATGLSWPAPCRFEALENRMLAWLGPDEFLLTDAGAGTASPYATAHRDPTRMSHAALAAAIRMMTNVGAGFTTIAVSGPGALELLARGCALDLHPRVFVEGDCLGTTFARTSVVLLHRGATGTGATRVEMIVRRSFADHVWRWLAAHGAEAGS